MEETERSGKFETKLLEENKSVDNRIRSEIGEGNETHKLKTLTERVPAVAGVLKCKINDREEETEVILVEPDESVQGNELILVEPYETVKGTVLILVESDDSDAEIEGILEKPSKELQVVRRATSPNYSIIGIL